MPDPHDETTADPEQLPPTSLHAYKEGRKEDIEGDADKLESNDPHDQQVRALESDGEGGPPEKH